MATLATPIPYWTPVRHPLPGGLLWEADRRWVVSLRDAMLLALAAVAATIVCRLVRLFFYNVGRQPVIQMAVAVLPWVLNAAAIWILARPAPLELRENVASSLQQMLAVAVLVPLAFLNDSGSWSPTTRHFLANGATWIALPTAILFFHRLTEIARLMQCRRLRVQAHLLLWAVPLTFMFVRLGSLDTLVAERSWVVSSLAANPQPVAGSASSVLPLFGPAGSCRPSISPNEVVYLASAAVYATSAAVLIQFAVALHGVVTRRRDELGSDAASSRP